MPAVSTNRYHDTLKSNEKTQRPDRQ
jgi:hypothetical protein